MLSKSSRSSDPDVFTALLAAAAVALLFGVIAFVLANNGQAGGPFVLVK